jgi:hypothetical protein
MLSSCYHLEKYWQKTNDKIDISLIRMFKLGPEVSFNGSPTVSPITAALWISLPFTTTSPMFLISPASIYFFALSQAPPVLEEDMAICTPLTIAPGRKPINALGPKKNPRAKGVTVT